MGNAECLTEKAPAGLPAGRVGSESARPSPFRALVWKEWREQRLIWAALLFLSLVAAVAAHLTPDRGMPRELLSLLIPFLWGGMAILLGANAFAGERDTDSEPFAAQLPVSRRKRFWVKVAVAAFLLWSAQALTAVCMPATHWAMAESVQEGYFVYYFYATFAFGMLLLTLTAACVAAWSGTALIVVVQAAVVGSCLTVWTAWMGKVLYDVTAYTFQSDAGARRFALLTPLLLAHAVLIGGALWLWTAGRGGFLRHFVRAAVLLLLFLLVSALPSAAGYFRVTMTAPILTGEWQGVIPSPGGRYALLDSGWRSHWTEAERVALLDVETSRTVRLSRLRASGTRSSTWRAPSSPWSPDGSRFVFFTSDDWSLPDTVARAARPFLRGTEKRWWCDATTGQRHFIGPIRSPDLNAEFSWWWDNSTVAFREGRGMVFMNVRTGDRKFCADAALAGSTGWLGDARVTREGIWTPVYARRYELHCYRPDAAVASILKPVVPGIKRGAFGVDCISPDGRWAVLEDQVQAKRQAKFLCSLTTGETIEMNLPALEPGDVVWDVQSFALDSRKLLVQTQRRVGLWDLASKELAVVFTPPRTARVGYRPMLSPSGKYLMVNSIQRVTSRRRREVQTSVVEVATGRTWPIWTGLSEYTSPVWLGDDHVLALVTERGQTWIPYLRAPVTSSLWVVNRDGTSKRKVLP